MYEAAASNQRQAIGGNYIGAPTTSMGIGNSPCEAATVIRDGISAAEQLVSELHDVIEGVERRIETALTPASPDIRPKDNGQPLSPGSHISGRLMIHNEAIRIAIMRLREITRRVEL